MMTTTATRKRKPRQPTATRKHKRRQPKRLISGIVGMDVAAKHLGISRWTLRSWVMEGRIGFIQYPGTRTRSDMRGVKFDVKDLDKYIERFKDRN